MTSINFVNNITVRHLMNNGDANRASLLRLVGIVLAADVLVIECSTALTDKPQTIGASR